MPKSGVRGNRARNYRKVKRLRDQGYYHREIAYLTGLSRSYVAGLLNDPTGDADRVRKAGYAGTCERCENPTDGSNGHMKAPRFCHRCAPIEARKWTPERVVEAIREWTRRYGRAPTASDWGTRTGVHVCRFAEDGYEFPWAGSCFDNQKGLVYPPFDTWADAIEAAGFPRPTSSRNYIDKDEWRLENMGDVKLTRQYVVFKVDEDGELEILDAHVEAGTLNGAVESAAVAGHARYAAVPRSQVIEFSAEPRFVASRNGRA